MKQIFPAIPKLLIVILISLLQPGCKYDSTGQYQYHIPQQTDDGITVGNINEVNIDTTLIFNAVDKIKSKRFKEVHSMLIFKDNKLILEEYFEGHQYQWDAPKHYGDLVRWDRTMMHSIMSDTKSITSTLVGIAVDKGYINDVNQSIFDFLPDHQHLKKNGKEKITIEHLLTMTSGLQWYEWGDPYSSIENPIIGIWFSDKDPVSFILDGELEDEPGTHFSYYGGCQIILGEIIKNATGTDIVEFSRKHLFEPLDIDKFDWAVQFDNGVYEAAGGLKLTPRAMAKIGITFLNSGVWQGEQIVSQSWVLKSTTPYGNNLGIKVPGSGRWRHGYSYGWWIKELKVNSNPVHMFYAGGWGGQNIMVLPELEMVVIFTGGNYLRTPPPKKILEKYILPALK